MATQSALAADNGSHLYTWIFAPWNWRVRVRWVGFGPMNRTSTWALIFLAVLLCIFAFTRFFYGNHGGHTFNAERIDPTGLVVYEMNLSDSMIRMTHSPLDIGQSKDIFDNDLETLMRGRDANPFILDFEFSQPQPVHGLVMDFGRMDFVMRVQVYGTQSSGPVLYIGVYQHQPPIPRVEMDFVNGPEQVERIYIEIEQLNPPDVVHIHVREVLFKE